MAKRFLPLGTHYLDRKKYYLERMDIYIREKDLKHYSLIVLDNEDRRLNNIVTDIFTGQQPIRPLYCQADGLVNSKLSQHLSYNLNKTTGDLEILFKDEGSPFLLKTFIMHCIHFLRHLQKLLNPDSACEKMEHPDILRALADEVIKTLTPTNDTLEAVELSLKHRTNKDLNRFFNDFVQGLKINSEQVRKRILSLTHKGILTTQQAQDILIFYDQIKTYTRGSTAGKANEAFIRMEKGQIKTNAVLGQIIGYSYDQGLRLSSLNTDTSSTESYFTSTKDSSSQPSKSTLSSTESEESDTLPASNCSPCGRRGT